MTTATRLLLVLCLPLLALAPPACRAAENLVQNPGFEETDAGKNLPAQWEPVYWSNPHGNVASSPQSRSGKWSVQLAGIPKERITDGEKRNNTLLVQDLGQAVTGLRKLTLRVFFKTEGDGRAYLSMTTADKDGRKLQYESTGRRENQADWGTIAWHFTTDSRTASLKIYLRNEGAGAVWYDDVSLAGADEVLENALARIVIEPLVGGRIRSFVWKATNEEKTVWHGVRPGGMAADLLPAGETPGFLRDAPYRLQVLDPAKRLLLRHEPSGPQWAGLVIEKEISLAADSAGVDVRLRVKNTADEPRTFALRAQQCLPPSPGTFTWPGRSGLGAWQPPAGPRRAAVSVQDLKEGWLACSGTDTESGTVALFDLARVGKARVYHSPEFSALEWTYEPVALAAGAVWETSYTVAALPQDFPVVMASREMALGLRPLGLGQAQDYALTLFSLRGQQSADVGISANAGKVKAAGTLKATVADPALLNLPGRGQRIGSIEVWVRAGSVKQSLSLSAKTLNDKPREEQPAPADLMDAFPAASGFFPYGEYLRGYVGSEMGSMQDLVVRSLRACRRNYLNTYMVYEGASLGPFKKDGACWISELLRQFDMRLIPRADMMRRFDAAGKESAPPDEATSAEAVARIAATGFDLPLRKAFAEKYGDVLLAYDYSDEPGPEYIPLYMHLQSVLRTADPAHPSLTILNLNQTAFLPYMPIYYGDEYPIRNRRQGGRNPWSMAQSVRGCAESTRAPVWVMLPAFGGYEEYTWHLPTGPEMRLMIYLAVANGAKGVTFHGSFSPPCWRYNQYYTHTAIDSWGAASDAWQAMGEAGRQVTAIGPSLLRTEVSAAGPFAVECAQITAGSGAATYKGPAATLGVLKEKDRDGCFLVLVNQDITNPQTATLSRSARPGAPVPA